MRESDTKSRLKKYLLEGGGLFIIAALICFFALSSRGRDLTRQFFDVIRTTPLRMEAVVVGIDDHSLQGIGAWPWDRKVFADLTKQLDGYGARVIVYDILFFEKRSGDEAFDEALKQAKARVILAGQMKGATYVPGLFADRSFDNRASAFSNVYPDADGKTRQYPYARMDGAECLYGLGEKAYRIFTFKENPRCAGESSIFFRYADNFSVYSASDVLSGTISGEKFKDKVVFVGATALGLGDNFVGMSGEKVPGIFIHANIFTSLMNKEGDKELSPFFVALLLFSCMLFTLWILKYPKTVLGQIAASVAISFGVFLIAYFLFELRLVTPLPWMFFSVVISTGFSMLVRYIREKGKNEYIEALFSKYVHIDVLRKLLKSPGAIHLTGERKYVTVLFSDLRGFTSFSEVMEPEELMNLLNKYFSAMTPIILEERGTIDKYIGDAIMAFWNAPLALECHEDHAVRAALLMQEALLSFNVKNGTTLAMGIGIHAGEVIVGNVGSEERMNYTILGDSVNLASRIESLTKKYKVGLLVTDEVKGKVTDLGVIFRKIDVVTVVGKNNATSVYEPMLRTEMNESVVNDYGEAFSCYQKGEFERAALIFAALAKKGDLPSEAMGERIKGIVDKNDWDGVWRWEEK